MNSELREISNWFKCNKLSLNASKTNLMYLGTVHQTNKIKGNNTEIYLDECRLTCVSSAKFLGITIDENINWKSHINNICKTCSRNIGVLNKVKLFLPKNILYQLYITMIQPYLNYGILLWGNANKLFLTKLFKLQKRALRIISNSSYLSHSKPLFEMFKIMDIFQMYEKESNIFMYKYKNGLLPKSFDKMFQNFESIHKYNTRHKKNYLPQIHKIKTILTSGPRSWNNLPKECQNSPNLKIFKRKLCTFIKSII